MDLKVALQIGSTVLAIGIACGVLSNRVDTLAERLTEQQRSTDAHFAEQQRSVDALYSWRDNAHLDGLAERVNSGATQAMDAKAIAIKNEERLWQFLRDKQ